MSRVIEVVNFKITTKTTAFLKANESMAQFLEEQEGMIDRSLCLNEETNTWVDIVHWQNMGLALAAQDAFMKSVAMELEPDRIRVSVVYPVGTRSEFFKVAAVASHKEKLADNTPPLLQQVPQQVARRVVACIRRPRHEVWPSRWGRIGVAIGGVWPGIQRRMMRKPAASMRRLIDADKG